MRLTNRNLTMFRLLIALALTTFSTSSATASRLDAHDKIDPWVTARASTTQEAEFIVVMSDRADLSAAAALPDKIAKGRYVRDALYAKALASQAPLVDWLRASGIYYQPFYIVNAVLVRGTLTVVEAIAERSDVARLDGNPTISSIAPPTLTPDEIAAAARATLSPQAIEPGITYIRAPEVWASGFTGQGIVIGAEDTGVRWTHAALKSKYRGWNGVTADHNYNWHDSIHSGGGICGPNSPAPCDDHGHGTHTVGTVVGADDTNTNQIGVAPGAKFIACRNMDQGSGTPARYLECMEFFLAPYPVGGTPAQGDPSKAPDITTNSWGCPPSEGCSPAILKEAVEAQRAAGIMFVAAAGNSGPACSSVSDPPAIYDAAYSVGAFSSATGDIASFSSRGPVTVDGSNRTKPDVTAPGVSVRSATRTSDVAYATLSGTSMSAPHVAGAVALLWSAVPALRHQIPQTEDALNQSAVHVTSSLCSSTGVPNNVYGWGRVDIKAAVDRGPVAVDPIIPATHGLWLGIGLPNPAHGSSLLRFRLEREGEMYLAVYSSTGQHVRTLLRGRHAAGEYAHRWDGLNRWGAAAPAGIYLVQLESRGQSASRKMVWLGQ